jgi:hypothetical protein
MTYFDENDLKETQINHRVELEYYRTNRCKEDNFEYGIEICNSYDKDSKCYIPLPCICVQIEIGKDDEQQG